VPTILACEATAQPSTQRATRTPPVGPKARFLPAPLIRARAAAFDQTICSDINRTARHVLYGILAFCNVKQPTSAIFASRETLCSETLLGSHPTMYRGLALLVEKGYIVREQARRVAHATYGQYHISRIWLQDKALQLLGLLVSPHSHPEVVQNAAYAIPIDHAARDKSAMQISEPRDLVTALAENFSHKRKVANQVLPSPESKCIAASDKEIGCLQEPSLTMSARLHKKELTTKEQLLIEEQPATNTNFAKPVILGKSLDKSDIDQKHRLPSELVPLLALGLSKARVCGLMSLARRNGHGGKLGIVMKLVWQRLQELQNSGAVFAYLATLLKQKKDYTRILAIQHTHDDPTKMAQSDLTRLTNKLPEVLDMFDGMEVATRTGKTLGVLTRTACDAGYVEGIDNHGVRRSLPVNLRFVAALEEGELTMRQAANEYEDYVDSSDNALVPAPYSAPLQHAAVAKKVERSTALYGRTLAQQLGKAKITRLLPEKLSELLGSMQFPPHAVALACAKPPRTVPGIVDEDVFVMRRASTAAQEKAMQQELAGKVLPMGRAANLALMRLVVKL
jgi:hypothetical protein